MEVVGEAKIAKFAKNHPQSRKPLARFLAVVRSAEWPHFPALEKSFPSTDYAPATGTLIFDIGGNKYRLLATINFERQILLIRDVLTHEEYNRENL